MYFFIISIEKLPYIIQPNQLTNILTTASNIVLGIYIIDLGMCRILAGLTMI